MKKLCFNLNRCFSISFSEYKNATIVDNRLNKDDNPSVIFTCEHALNTLPSKYKWLDSDLKNFSNTHWSHDIGALKLAQNLAKKMKTLLVHSNFSRLLCDVNRPITSETLFRKEGDGNLILLNKNIAKEEEEYRLERYYYSYYSAFREISLKIKPKIIISIHSYTPLYEGQKREVEVGVLSSFSNELSQKIKNEFDAKKYKCELDKPWSGKEGFCFAVDHLILAQHPIERQGAVIEFRNDLLVDNNSFTRILNDMDEILNKFKN